MTLYDPQTAPDVYDVVWCKFPLREKPGEPGPWARPTLVLDSRLMVTDDGVEWADITVAYGTDADKIKNPNAASNLLIPQSEFKALGLHKPTGFQIGLSNRRRMPWGDKYFVPPEYVRNQGIICGKLNKAQQIKFHECFQKLGLQFPLP